MTENKNMVKKDEKNTNKDKKKDIKKGKKKNTKKSKKKDIKDYDMYKTERLVRPEHIMLISMKTTEFEKFITNNVAGDISFFKLNGRRYLLCDNPLILYEEILENDNIDDIK